MSILDRGGKPMLGRQPVVDRQYVCAGVAAENSARAVVRVEVAVEEPAAVVEDEQRVGAAGLGRDVVAGAERHRRDRPRRSRDRAPMRPAPACPAYAAVRRLARLPGVGRRQRLERRLAPARRAPREAAGPRARGSRRRSAPAACPTAAPAREGGSAPSTCAPHCCAQLAGGTLARGTRRCYPPRARAASAAPPPSQLTAERANVRIEIAVSAAANSATTARLSHASAVTLLIPQMSCSPLPLGSTNA